ncbi:MAG: COX15/CtaA family protein [Pseudomonadota bacterium]
MATIIDTMQHRWFTSLLFIASLLTLVLILTGSWLRLSDSGLGCPDFPGCHGQLYPPQTASGSNNAYDAAQAWRSMVHRYLAVLFAIIVVVLVIAARRMKSGRRYSLPLYLALLLTLLQGGLGFLTISMQLHPAVVSLHLLTAMLILALLWSVYLNSKIIGARYCERLPEINLRPWTVIAFLLVSLQILLGGFTSSNYAALACPDLPTCQQQWLPELDLSGIGQLLSRQEGNYQGGLLSNRQSVTVHMLHRYGAVITFFYIALLSFLATRKKAAIYRNAGLLLAVVLLLQIQLGAANILLLLPLPVALAHTGGAALLLLCLVYLHHLTRHSKVSIYSK